MEQSQTEAISLLREAMHLLNNLSFALHSDESKKEMVNRIDSMGLRIESVLNRSGEESQIKKTMLQAWKTAQDKGWHEDVEDVPKKLMLIVCEAAEAMEDYRENKMDLTLGEKGKPCGFPSELADILIRVFDLAQHMNIDLEDALYKKMEYNKKRPYRHGGKIA